MHYLQIPRTSLTVSAVCLGTSGVGISNTEAEAFALLDRYVELGGNFLESARVYSDWIPGERGRSERILGDWMAARKNRARLVISTKGGHSIVGIPGASGGVRLSRKELAIDLAESRAALRVDCIDLYSLHRDDPRIPVAEIIETLESFVAEGRIRYYGCSNWAPERMALAMEYAASKGRTGFVANQMEWHIALRYCKPFGDSSMVPQSAAVAAVMQKHQIAAIPHTSQANGFFSKMATVGPSREKAVKSRFYSPENLELFLALQVISQRHALAIEALVLGFFTLHPLTVIPSVGPNTRDHLEATMAAVESRLSPECLRDLAVVMEKFQV